MAPLYIDHNVPSAIAAGLRKRGVDVITCLDDNTTTLDDDLLIDRSTLLGRVLFTQDADLLAIARPRQQVGQDFSGVAYAHQLNISISQAIRYLELLT